MKPKDIMLSEISQIRYDKYCKMPFIRRVKFTKTECRTELIGGGRRENEKLLFNWYRLSTQDDEKVLEMHRDDCYTTL